MHKITTLLRALKHTTAKHSPEILIGMGIAGGITATVLAVKATPDAILDIENEKRRINNEIQEEAAKNGDTSVEKVAKLKPVDTVKVAWKHYIPAAITGTISIACIIGASSVNLKRNAALATAYSLAETSLSEYKSKVIETIGEKKEQAIHDEIAKDKLEKAPVWQESDIIVTGKGETLCFDSLTGRPFKSSMESIRKIVNDVNLRMRDENYISLNEFYYEMGLPMVAEAVGDMLGWNISKNGYIEPVYSSQLTSNGIPCLVVGYQVGPICDYKSIW